MRLDSALFVSILFFIIHGVGSTMNSTTNSLLTFLFTGIFMIIPIYILSRFIYNSLSFLLPFPLSFLKIFIPVIISVFLLIVFIITDFTLGDKLDISDNPKFSSIEFYYTNSLKPLSHVKSGYFGYYGFFICDRFSNFVLNQKLKEIPGNILRQFVLSFICLTIIHYLSCLGIGAIRIANLFVILNISTMILI